MATWRRCRVGVVAPFACPNNDRRKPLDPPTPGVGWHDHAAISLLDCCLTFAMVGVLCWENSIRCEDLRAATPRLALDKLSSFLLFHSEASRLDGDGFSVAAEEKKTLVRMSTCLVETCPACKIMCVQFMLALLCFALPCLAVPCRALPCLAVPAPRATCCQFSERVFAELLLSTFWTCGQTIPPPPSFFFFPHAWMAFCTCG